MTLLIDLGNSAVKWSWLSDGTLLPGGRQLHRGKQDIETLLAADWGGRGQGARAVGCSVAADAVRNAVASAARQAGIVELQWLQSQARSTGAVQLVNDYRDPAQLGADRWHALLGAVSMRPGASLIVANAGTATTVDCVQSSGGHSARFVGGCIAPGARLMRESLSQGAAGLPLSDGEAMPFPDNTASAIASGVLDAQVGLLERVWARFSRRIGATPEVLLAGGNAPLLAAALPKTVRATIEDNLVLRGIALRLGTE